MEQRDNPVPLRTDMWQRPESNLPYGTARWFHHQEHKSWGPRDRQKEKGLPITQPMTPPASQPATRPSICPSKRNMLPFLSPSPFPATRVAPSGNSRSKPHESLPQCVFPLSHLMPPLGLSFPGDTACLWDVQCGPQQYIQQDSELNTGKGKRGEGWVWKGAREIPVPQVFIEEPPSWK